MPSRDNYKGADAADAPDATKPAWTPRYTYRDFMRPDRAQGPMIGDRPSLRTYAKRPHVIEPSRRCVAPTNR
jgi:hypothetical protein